MCVCVCVCVVLSLTLSLSLSLYACMQGRVTKKKEVLEVRIERGMEDGRKIVFKEKADEMPGCITGDGEVDERSGWVGGVVGGGECGWMGGWESGCVSRGGEPSHGCITVSA